MGLRNQTQPRYLRAVPPCRGAPGGFWAENQLCFLESAPQQPRFCFQAPAACLLFPLCAQEIFIRYTQVLGCWERTLLSRWEGKATGLGSKDTMVLVAGILFFHPGELEEVKVLTVCQRAC